jgi:Icc-related predicted phosphoesterase
MEGRMQLDLGSQKLNVLFISDLHMQLAQVERLGQQVRAQKLHFDYCLVGGDLANCDHANKTHHEEATLEQTQQLLTAIQDIFQCKVLFVPGNHDPLAYLAGAQHPCPDIVNIHKREFVLEVGLSIVGLGGSLPGYADEEFKEEKWAGFPYQSEEEYRKDVEAVFKQDELQTSKIYLVHNGPAISNTTVDRSK